MAFLRHFVYAHFLCLPLLSIATCLSDCVKKVLNAFALTRFVLLADRPATWLITLFVSFVSPLGNGHTTTNKPVFVFLVKFKRLFYQTAYYYFALLCTGRSARQFNDFITGMFSNKNNAVFQKLNCFSNICW